MTSPSMPCTSVMWVMRRVPSRRRVSCTIRSMADAICSRMARTGRSKPAMSTSVSRRASVSRGLLAWTVVSEPSWPVFMAWSMSSASPRAALADHDAVGAHAQGVLDEVADGDLAPALDVRRAGLHREHVVLVELELLGVLDGDDALVGGDERRQHVRASSSCRCRYRRRRSTLSRPTMQRLEEPGRVGVERAEADQVVDLAASRWRTSGW